MDRGRSPEPPRLESRGPLDGVYDVAPVDLDQEIPAGVGVLVVPLLSALTQPELDRLSEVIDTGLPAVVIVDPLPIVDLVLMPGSEIRGRFDRDATPEPGDDVAFLGKHGVRWANDAVLVGSLRVGEAPAEVLVVDGRGPVVVGWAGAIENVGATVWDPILTARGSVDVATAEDYVSRHPLFGTSGPLPSRGASRAWPGPAVIASKVHGDLIVAADLDIFSDRLREGPRVATLIRALDAARWRGASKQSPLLDPTLDSPSTDVRLIARDADGRTLLDLVVGEGVARPTYSSTALQLRIETDLATDEGAFVRAVQLGIDPRKVESIAVSRYRLDLAHGELTDRADSELGSSRPAAARALSAIELTPHERLQATAMAWRVHESRREDHRVPGARDSGASVVAGTRVERRARRVRPAEEDRQMRHHLHALVRPADRHRHPSPRPSRASAGPR